jgi:hypothetical protein
MIDWTKPIETVDGRKARKITTAQNELWNIVFVPGENFGDVFLVSAEGFICGDRTDLGAKRYPFIRNVKVKKEGWTHALNGAVVFSRREIAEGQALPGEIIYKITWEE